MSRAVLLNGLESDAAGIWEVVWDLRTASKEADLDETRAAVRTAALGLHGAGMITAGRGRWHEGLMTEVLTSAAFDAALREDDAWVPPAHGAPSLLFCTTDAGRDHYVGPQRGRWVGPS